MGNHTSVGNPIWFSCMTGSSMERLASAVAYCIALHCCNKGQNLTRPKQRIPNLITDYIVYVQPVQLWWKSSVMQGRGHCLTHTANGWKWKGDAAGKCTWLVGCKLKLMSVGLGCSLAAHTPMLCLWIMNQLLLCFQVDYAFCWSHFITRYPAAASTVLASPSSSYPTWIILLLNSSHIFLPWFSSHTIF